MRVAPSQAGGVVKPLKSTSPSRTGRRQKPPRSRKTWLTSLSGPNRESTGATGAQSENQLARTKAMSRSLTSVCRWAYSERRSQRKVPNFVIDPNGELGPGKRTDRISPSARFLEMYDLPRCTTLEVVVARCPFHVWSTSRSGFWRSLTDSMVMPRSISPNVSTADMRFSQARSKISNTVTGTRNGEALDQVLKSLIRGSWILVREWGLARVAAALSLVKQLR